MLYILVSFQAPWNAEGRRCCCAGVDITCSTLYRSTSDPGKGWLMMVVVLRGLI